jgi:thiol-disulfide isomerase/thioredoxin
MMRRLILLTLGIWIFQTALFSNNPSQTTFFKGSLEEAFKKAGEEGKLILIDFYAEWCTPSIWMKETTYADSLIQNLMDHNYISTRIDIDDIQGYAMKEKYEVKYLPTILILSSSGKLLLRIEETLSPNQMKQALERFNKQEHKTIQKHMLNQSPVDSPYKLDPQLTVQNETSLETAKNLQNNQTAMTEDSLQTMAPETSVDSLAIETQNEVGLDTSSNEKSILPLSQDIDTIATPFMDKALDEKPIDSLEVDKPQEATADLTEDLKKEQNRSIDAVNMVELDTLGNFEYSKKVLRIYRLQIGVYSQFRNTYKVVNDLKKTFADPVIVLNDSLDDKVIYRVFLGEFNSLSEAEEFKNMMMKKHNIDAVIK